jgi:Polyketide cyclase / dehydrase and lipid transport
MSVTERTINATPAQVTAVLADGWNYADWVVGAVHIRNVDPLWPQPGSRVHHRVGAWPLTINDTTEVISWDPGNSLLLKARAWPFGEATVRLTWHAESPGATQVRMEEQFVGGPALALRNQIGDVALHARNKEALTRLEHLTRKYPDPVAW